MKNDMSEVFNERPLNEILMAGVPSDPDRTPERPEPLAADSARKDGAPGDNGQKPEGMKYLPTTSRVMFPNRGKRVE